MQTQIMDIVHNSVQTFRGMTEAEKETLLQRFREQMKSYGYKTDNTVASRIFLGQLQDLAKTPEDQEMLFVISLCIFA